MTATSRRLPARARAWLPARRPHGWPSPAGVGRLLAGLLVVVMVSAALSSIAYLRLPAPTGAFGIGRAAVLLTDPSRDEPHTPAADDRREVRLVAWYPTDAPTATGRGRYLVDIDAIDEGLLASGELGPIPVAALRIAASNALDGSALSGDRPRWPVLILSPGNATNVEFYGTLAEELASNGYVVIGVDHPYQVTAVALGSGAVAVYEGDGEAPAMGDVGTAPRRIAERVADIRFVLDRLAAGDTGLTSIDRALDLDRIGILGHSNGGIAGAELCATDARVDACLNIDGQLAGGPFSSDPDPRAPTKPFMFLTKETSLHPQLAGLFEQGDETYRVVVPAATHDSFADGARFEPRPLPIEGDADRTLRVTRGFAVAFFDHTLRDAPLSVLGAVDAPTDVLLEVYPLTPR